MAEKMLVIDDEVSVLDSCRKVFSSEGYDVSVTSSPREGLELAKGSRFDVILCDWMMPEFSGMDVLEELERISPESTVVMISGYPNVGRATEALKRGAMDYIAKPFTPEEILETVRRATQRKVTEEKKTINRFEKIAKSWQFPVPAMEDKTPKTIAETVATTVGVGKVTSPWFSVLVLGILAGAYIGFGGLLATSVTFDLASKAGIGIQKLVAGSAFSLGLMLVVIAGAELFTGNNLMISSVLSREIGFQVMLQRWGLVFLANFVGSVLLALIFYFSGLWKTGNGALGASALATALNKVQLGFGEALARGIGCNWLVCLAVWLSYASREMSGKILGIWFPIMAFVAIGFQHVVANMFLIPAAIFAGYLSWGQLLENLAAVFLGNAVGGAIFVGLAYYVSFGVPAQEQGALQ